MRRFYINVRKWVTEITFRIIVFIFMALFSIFISSCGSVGPGQDLRDNIDAGAAYFEQKTGTVLYVPLIKWGDKSQNNFPPDPDTPIIQDIVDEDRCLCPCSCEDYYQGLRGWSSCQKRP